MDLMVTSQGRSVIVAAPFLAR